MKAVVLRGVTPAEEITLSKVTVPKPVPGWVLVRVRAFGMNHSEQVLRLFEIENDYIQKPIIPGIECVGEVADLLPEDAERYPQLKVGQKVAALMGGMGRSFNGSYAEYALLPANHVFAVESSLDWAKLAAVPETYFTAWGSLFECLQLKASDTLLVRGATCALGYAAIQLARALGAKVVTTTHRESKLPLLDEADEAILDDGILSGKVHGITKALDLVGCRNLLDTLSAVEKGAVVCNTGILGGVFAMNGFDPIKDIPNGVYLTGFFSNFPDALTIRAIFDFMEMKKLSPKIGAHFEFKDIREACVALDSGKVNGKIVVTI